MAKCIACLQGFPWECKWRGNCDGRQSESSTIKWEGETDLTNSDFQIMQEAPSNSEASSLPVPVSYVPGMPEREVQAHDDSSIRDQQSTGRKRAAVAYPLHPELHCEWRGKKKCGGGNHPIVGCLDGKQEARHHGPDKNTLNNEPGNVHRICHKCHNRWHTVNDDEYIWGSTYAPHSPEKATPDELFEGEAIWAGHVLKAAKD